MTTYRCSLCGEDLTADEVQEHQIFHEAKGETNLEEGRNKNKARIRSYYDFHAWIWPND